MDMPQGIQNFFMEAVDTAYDSLLKDYSLSPEKLFDDVEKPILMCALGAKNVGLTFSELDTMLKTYNLDDAKRKAALEFLLKNVFWPLRDFYGDELTVYLREQKIESSSWPQTRVLYRPVSFSGVASEIVNRLGLYSMGQNVRTQLRQFVSDYVNQKSVPSQIKEAMMRTPDFGGLGFDEKAADKALEILQGFKTAGLEILTEEAYADYLNAQTSKLAQSLRQPSGQEAAEQAEIATIRAAQPAPPRIVTELDKAVQAAIEAIPDRPTDAYLANRLQNVVSSRLRDVRNAGELLSLLQRDSKVGGMGLDRDKANAWSAIIEKAYQEHRGQIESEERGKLETQLAEQKRKIEDRRRQEAETHAKWYQEKIKSRQAQEQERLKLAEAIKKGWQTQAPPPPVEQKAAAAEKKELGELVPATGGVGGRTSDVGSGQGVVESQKSKVATGTVGMQPATRDAGRGTVEPVVKVSAVTAQMAAQAAGAPKPVDGVKPSVGAPKLQGLVGELANLSLPQFRRMGKTPQEATAKILQRLETLKQESFENKMNGVRSWQQSPVMKAYMELVAKSFKSGKPIAQIAETERSAGKDTLTPEEIEALVSMNNQLHF